jgi:hypothetical protein
MENREDGTTILNIGKSRSGKTSIIKAVEKLHGRSLAFDPKTEWCELGFELHETKESLFNALVNSNKNTKISFASYDKKDFDFWSACAFNFNREKETFLIAEELGAVTDTNRASANWGRLVNQGLGFGMVLMGTVQRGQEVDKTIINNSTAINVFQHSTEQDAKSMADRIGVDIEEIPRSPMEFIVWTPVHGIIIKKGRVTYKNNVPRFTGIKKGTSRPVNLALQANGMFKGVHYL